MLPITRVPLVGRQRERQALGAALDAAKRGRGSVHILAGEAGIGKTRLTEALIEQASQSGFVTVIGRAYPVETGVPFALLADAFVPLLREIPAANLLTLTRGGAGELATLFPTLRGDASTARLADHSDLRARLFDTFAGLVHRLAQKQPMLVVLENLHWADPSSLDLFHFLARGVQVHPIIIVGSYNDVQRESNRNLRLAEQSLGSLGVLQRYLLPALTGDEAAELVAAHFAAPVDGVRDFARRLHTRTRGNAFFIEETLKTLVEQGRLRQEDGRWVGWNTEQLALPDSIRDALSLRYEHLSDTAKQVVQIAAVIAVHAPHALLERLAGVGSDALLAAIDELRKGRILEEVTLDGRPAYVFSHPMMQDMLYAELSTARMQGLHAEIADALEAFYGSRALEHADEIAVHFARAESPEQSARAVSYLLAAGRMALARGAAREADESLARALALLERNDQEQGLDEVLTLLGRARHKLGDYRGAQQHWRRAVARAEAQAAAARIATLERRLGVAAMRMGDFAGALEHLERGLAAATQAQAELAEVELRLARASVLMDVGRGEEARTETLKTLAVAERTQDPRLLAQIHQALQALAVWRGPSAAALEHGARALAYAQEAQDARSAWQAEWMLALHAGLTGDSAGTALHLAEAERLAEELRSPILRLWTAEVAIEYRSGIGEWDAALTIAAETIESARAFGQRLLLPRVLVWSGLIHCGRGELETAKKYFDEAWELSGAARSDGREPVVIHTVLPAHVGLAYYHMARRDFRTALQVGERALAVADRTGYEVWAVHRLLPLLAECSLWLREFERSTAYAARLREAASRLGHPLALAWADTSDALQLFLRDGRPDALDLGLEAADKLDAIPFVEHAARLRRRLADLLKIARRDDDAERELRRVYKTFTQLRATQAIDDCREKFIEWGIKVPVVEQARRPAGPASLTPMQLKVAKLAAQGLSNKKVGERLGMSHRTVGKHLEEVYKRLDIPNRTTLAAKLLELGI